MLIVATFVLVILSMLVGGLSLNLWSQYNIKRYGHLNRRQSGIGLVDKNNAYPPEIFALRMSSHILLDVDGQGKIRSVCALDQ